MDNNDARADRVGDEVRVAHTPGPWRSSGFDYEPEAGWFIREGGDRYLAVARVASSHRSTGEIEANARLISAAPDEHSALHNAVEFLWFYFLSPDAASNRKVEGDQNMIAEARKAYEVGKAAIAKAEGRLS